jgi:adenylosuccinate synthase
MTVTANVTAVVGANWGDEGKGRIIDALATRSDLVVRFQGGANAGHTVISEAGKFVFRLLPSGVLHPAVLNVLGPGVAVDAEVLAGEREEITRRTGQPPRLVVSDRAQLVLPHHRLLDRLDEQRLGAASIGSTRSGIAPHYADRHARRGVTIDDLLAGPGVAENLAPRSLWASNQLLQAHGQPPVAPEDLAATLERYRTILQPLVGDTTRLLSEARRTGRSILLEGQLGALRDPDHGIYPYVTSSSPLAGFAAVGAGLPPWAITRILAVTKAYASCVGAGPFVTELTDGAGDELRRRGGDAGEFGAVTGRPRRVGYFDAVATRHGCQVQGATELAVTCLDVLGYLPEIPICTAYAVDGQPTADFPTTRRLARATPIYQTLPGWGRSLNGARRLQDLPAAARRYLDRIQELTDLPIRWVSVGAHRDALIDCA